MNGELDNGSYTVPEGTNAGIQFSVAKILLVDDDQELCTTVTARLKLEGHTLDVANDGEGGKEYLAMGSYDLIILDWTLPNGNGVDLLRNFRAGGGTTPVIMLTGNSTLQEKETGLDAGADDYLTKPFSTRELAARIRALLRRPAAMVPNVLSVNGVELDPIAHKVRKNGKDLHLQPKDFALLEFFMRNVGVVFPSEAIIQRVWGHGAEVSMDGLRAAIKRIRQQIDAGGDESASLIETVPRVGYGMRRPE